MPKFSLEAENGKVTMRDVARHAQVAQSTVSRVLSRGREYDGGNDTAFKVAISEDTARRVQDSIRELGYYPNLAARSLRGQKTQMIALMIADIANPYYHQMVRRIQDIAHLHKYDVLISNTDHLHENEHHFIEGIIRRPVDGVILVPYHLSVVDIDALIRRTGVSVVALGQHLDSDSIDTVYADDGTATYEAVSWLIKEKGHRHIAFVGVSHTAPGERRKSGYMQAMQEAGLLVAHGYIVDGDFSLESGEGAMNKLMDLARPPTAVFACNDLMALGCLAVARARGKRVPSEVAVIGFDNIPEATRHQPSLTTVAQFPNEMGECLANALFERIGGLETETARRYNVPCKLIVRDST